MKLDDYHRFTGRFTQLVIILFWIAAPLITLTSFSSEEWARYWPGFVFAAVFSAFMWMVAEYFIRSSE